MSVCVCFHVWRHMYVGVCGGLKLMSKIILNCFSTLLTEAGSLNQTWSFPGWIVLSSQFALGIPGSVS